MYNWRLRRPRPPRIAPAKKRVFLHALNPRSERGAQGAQIIVFARSATCLRARKPIERWTGIRYERRGRKADIPPTAGRAKSK